MQAHLYKVEEDLLQTEAFSCNGEAILLEESQVKCNLRKLFIAFLYIVERKDSITSMAVWRTSPDLLTPNLVLPHFTCNADRNISFSYSSIVSLSRHLKHFWLFPRSQRTQAWSKTLTVSSIWFISKKLRSTLGGYGLCGLTIIKDDSLNVHRQGDFQIFAHIQNFKYFQFEQITIS